MVHANALFVEALFTKLFPVLLAAILFIALSVWSPLPDLWQNPLNAVLGLFFTLLAIAFIYEMFFALPDHEGSPGGIFAAVLVSGLAIITGAISLGFWFEFIDSSQLVGEVNFAVSILLLLAIGVYLLGARELLVHGGRTHEAFKRL